MIQAPTTRQEAHDVPLNQVEAKLAELWRESDAATLAGGGQVLARNSVMTLVVYAQDLERAHYAARTIEGLTGQHPSRSIVLALQPDAQGAPVTASVSIHGHAPTSGAGLMRAEQIMLEVRGEATQHVHSIVLPLLLTEMPTFVWWAGPLPTGSAVENLIEMSDRSIVDSTDFAQPEQDLARLVLLGSTQASSSINRTAFGDFNWSRINPWRELTAQFFDVSNCRPYLDGIERVEIEYAIGQTSPNASQAYIFAGWIASRLKWQTYTRYTEQGVTRLGLHTHTGAPVTIEIGPRAGIETHDWWSSSSAEWPIQIGNEPAVEGEVQGQMKPQTSICNGALMRIHMQSRVKGKTATFTIVRENDLKSVTTIAVVDGEVYPQRRTPMDMKGETELLHQQLNFFDHNPVYEAALAATYPMVVADNRITKGR
jgi:glucose-6-phosphate dehydrogenase assembly protein OpcA